MPLFRRRVAPHSTSNELHALSENLHVAAHRHSWRQFYHDMYCRVGDELRFSPGFFTDLWHWLCSDISVPWLVVVYFVFEVLYVLFFALILLLFIRSAFSDMVTRPHGTPWDPMGPH